MRKKIIAISLVVAIGFTGLVAADFALNDFRPAETSTEWTVTNANNTDDTHYGGGYVATTDQSDNINVRDPDTGNKVDTITGVSETFITGIHDDIVYAVSFDGSSAQYGINQNVGSLNSSYNYVEVERQNGNAYLLYTTDNFAVGTVNLDTGEKTQYANPSFHGNSPSSATRLSLMDNGNLLVYDSANAFSEVSESSEVWSDTVSFSSDGGGYQTVDMNDDVFAFANFSYARPLAIYDIEEMRNQQSVSAAKTFDGDTIPIWTAEVTVLESNVLVKGWEDTVVYNSSGGPKAHWGGKESWYTVYQEDYEINNENNIVTYQAITPENDNHSIHKFTTDVPVEGQQAYNPSGPDTDNGIEYNPDGEKENIVAQREFQDFYSADGGSMDPADLNRERVLGIDSIGNTLYWNVYTEGAEGSGTSRFETRIYDPTDEPSTGSIAIRTGRQVFMDNTITSPKLSFSVFPDYPIEPWADSRMFPFQTTSDGSGLITPSGFDVLYLSAETTVGDHTVVEDDSTGEIMGFDNITINNESALIYGAEQGPVVTYLYYPETGDKVQVASGGVNREKFDAFVTNDSHVVSFVTNYSVGATDVTDSIQAVDLEEQSANYFDQTILGYNDQYVAAKSPDGIDVFNRENFGEMLSNLPYQNRIPVDYAVGEVPYPNGVEGYDKGFYEGQHWFMVNEQDKTIDVYNDDFSDIEATLSDPWSDYDGNQTYFEPYIENNTIKYATAKDNQIELYNTTIQVPQQSGCAAYLKPAQLQEFWNADTVCWIPIFTGTWVLETIYQWVLLGILIAIPVSKLTNNDIATMATIDGVLLVGMLTGSISPGFVAIALLTSVLLASYHTNKSEVNINNMGGGGI